jgi:hypothetical protein
MVQCPEPRGAPGGNLPLAQSTKGDRKPARKSMSFVCGVARVQGHAEGERSDCLLSRWYDFCAQVACVEKSSKGGAIDKLRSLRY